jgi:LAO/AO transport system kinase
MQDHATDPGVFIRSMATRGHLGGLSQAAPQALRVLDAAGFAVLLVETVGVGQAEVEVASLADTTLVLVAPDMGDAIQAAKAGILEVADVFVVNKADKPGAQETVRDLRTMIAMARHGVGEWKPPIVTTIAVQGEGIADLAAKVDAHWSWLDSTGQGAARRRARAREEIAAIAVAELRQRVGGLPGDSRLDALADKVAAGEMDPFTAADEILGATPAAAPRASRPLS